MSSEPERRGERHRHGHPAGPHGWLHGPYEPRILFPGIAVVVLAVIWGTSANLIAREQAAAQRSAVALTADIADTYEAQAVRALREIDQALKLTRHQLRERNAEDVLSELGDEGLLPPEFLFTVAVTNAEGDITAANDDLGITSMATFEAFRRARVRDALAVGMPRRSNDADAGESRLHFTRPRHDVDGEFAGVVAISVHTGYFVSGYDADSLGDQGVLGLVATDGVFRARRTGDAVTVGTEVDYENLLGQAGDGDSLPPAVLLASPWDETRRYTIARELFEFPVAIVVGLAEDEQLATAAGARDVYLWRAGGISALVVAVIGLLGYLSGRLQQARTRVMEERIEHAQRVEHLAFHDALTGLPNRAFFTHLLTREMQRAHRYHRKLALLFLDLDRFKTINDSLGHEAGDELLHEIGRRLHSAVRDSDLVARLGGDEFVVLLPEIDRELQAGPVAETILSAAARPFTLSDQEFRITVSIGISIHPDDGEDEQTLMKHADVAMYHAKQQGKNNFQFYSDDLSTNSFERLALETNLRAAIERGELCLHYQAKRKMSSGEVTGMEALLRWEHPELGLIAPRHFIPLAEETGLIVPIGRWALRTACEQNMAWQRQGLPRLGMAVNLSARQFVDEALLDDVDGALRTSGMDPGLLEVEITESMVMQDIDQAVRILSDLKRMGVRVAIDDFGTGYSSLSALRQYPLDAIKIDQSFIRDLVLTTEDGGLTEAIITMGRRLSLRVVAEGVETVDQYEFLRTHDCDEFQGFYGSGPMPANEFEQLLRRDRAEGRPPE